MPEIGLAFDKLLGFGTTVAVSVAAFFLAWGGFLYMSAAGSPHQMERGKQAIVNAVVGLAVVLLARALADAIRGALPIPK